MKLEARANPNLFMATIRKYQHHGTVNRIHMEGVPVPPQPGEGAYYAQSGYNNAAVNYQYPSPYAPQQFLAANYGYPMLKPPPQQKEKEASEEVYKQHTAPPSYAMQPPPPMPLSSYSYVEPPYWPTPPASGGKCVIM
ncbi:unnamed protein product [Eruca vesicaria subsp. sativa]|uniref:Uncharacterized protein n=1 Tax=Eruca vesicaria subsp. sativa TaxID=29727 RepID=A0ABC8L2T2_ERUVS|nr:unnamed protein product [Eruca vesicaria subsp. sativa]